MFVNNFLLIFRVFNVVEKFTRWQCFNILQNASEKVKVSAHDFIPLCCYLFTPSAGIACKQETRNARLLLVVVHAIVM